jgi:RNA polymerase sigma-70 factor (ECF subfamily)
MATPDVADGQAPAGKATPDERLVAGLRAGNESVFAELIDSYGESMLRIACGVVTSSAVAEEVVQETWLAVFTGVHRFEGRSSLRTWIFRILMNTAHTQRTRDARTLPFSDLGPELSSDEPAVDPERFLPADHHRWPGHWSSPPQPWQTDPESRVLATETLQVIRGILDTLPLGQRTVVTLRDVQGWTPEEVSEALGVSRGNQRVLLHRARTRLRAALEDWMQGPRRALA